MEFKIWHKTKEVYLDEYFINQDKELFIRDPMDNELVKIDIHDVVIEDTEMD